MTTIAEIRAKITLDNQAFKKGMDEVQQKTSETNAATKKNLDGIQQASAVVTSSILAAIGASVKVAADFEQGMAKVKAVSGASAEEMAKLEAVARKMGSETQFSAMQASEALAFLAQSGFSVEEQIGALPAVLNAAAAGGIELGQAADITSNIMSSFGIAAEDAESAVDVLVKTAATANVDLPMMAESMKMVAPVSKSLGLSIEETAAAIGVLGNNGIQGSSAGTALRAMLLSLANPAGQAKDAIEKLGIEVINADGSMKPFPELIGHIGDKLEGMGDAQKTATAAQLVGTEAAAGFLALLEVGEGGLADYTAELENSAGAAQEMADVQMDTLQGSFKEFQSALEEVGIKIGNEFLPAFRDIIDVGADVVRFFGELDGDMVKNVATFAGVTAGVAGLITTIAKLSAALSAFALTPVGAAIIGVSLLAGGIAAVTMASNDAKEVNLEYAESLIAERAVLDDQIATFDSLQDKMKLSTDELGRFMDINSEMRSTVDPIILEQLANEQERLLEKSGLTNEEMQKFLEVQQALVESVPGSSTAISDQGNVMLETTDAAKKLNAEKAEFLRLELESQLATAQANEADNLREQGELIEAINKAKERTDEIVTQISDKERHIRDLQAEYQTQKEEGNEILAQQTQNQINFETEELQTLKEKLASQTDIVVSKTEELQVIEKELGQLDAVKQKMVDLELQQVGITAEKGKGLTAIDQEIAKLEQAKSKLEQNTPAAARNTEEYRRSVAEIDGQISALSSAKSRVMEITEQAGYMNTVLGQAVTKTVTVRTTNVGGGAIPNSGPTPQLRHQGGIVGQGPIKTRPSLPALDTSGMLANLQQRFAQPMAHEMDVRMLRNEMVLTESQQANLMRLIDAGHSNKASAAPAMGPINVKNNITVQGNIDSDLYEAFQRQQFDELAIEEYMRGIRDDYL